MQGGGSGGSLFRSGRISLQAGYKLAGLIQLLFQRGQAFAGGLRHGEILHRVGAQLIQGGLQHFRVVFRGQFGEGEAGLIQSGGGQLLIGGTQDSFKQSLRAGVQRFVAAGQRRQAFLQGSGSGFSAGGSFGKRRGSGRQGSGSVLHPRCSAGKRVRAGYQRDGAVV